MAIQAQETLGAKTLNVVADKGYYSGGELLMCDSVGITALVPKPLTSVNTALGLFGKERFIYDSAKDVYVCPAGQELTYRFSTNEKQRPIRYYRASACKECALRGNGSRTPIWRPKSSSRACYELTSGRLVCCGMIDPPARRGHPSNVSDEGRAFVAPYLLFAAGRLRPAQASAARGV